MGQFKIIVFITLNYKNVLCWVKVTNSDPLFHGLHCIILSHRSELFSR